jgi:polyisoprenoid-binding protein YceI
MLLYCGILKQTKGERMKRPYWIIGMSIVLVIIIAGVSYAMHFASTVNPVHTPTGVAPTSAATTTSGVATTCGTPIPSTGLRTFQIVPAQTTASYKVHENLILRNLPSTDAIGTTHSVQGSFRLRTEASPLVAAMNITVDMSTLQTNEPMRDRFVRRNALETDSYPTATFVSTCAQGLPATYSDGQMVNFQLVGSLTLHGKTNQEVFAVQGRVTGQTVTGTATSTIYMTDFGVQPPNLANIAIAENKVIITVTFTAKEGA